MAKQEAEQIVAEARAHMERERATLKREALHIEQAQTAKIAQRRGDRDAQHNETIPGAAGRP